MKKSSGLYESGCSEQIQAVLESVVRFFRNPMETTLIYNPQAGSTSKVQPDEILQALRQAGYNPTYSATETEKDLDAALAKAKDFVVVAGGDGSIRAVATRLLGRNIRIVPLPLGTANNIARMLALTGTPLEIIAGLANPVERDMDMGRVITPQGPEYFLEAMGIGAYADVMEKYNPEDGKSIQRSIETLLSTLNGYQPKFFHINLDGEDFSGSYFLCEVMNTPTVGFHFMLAPEARPDDGLFDLVLIHANQREGYLKFMKGILMGTLESLPEVSIHRGRTLEIAWRGFPLHLDGTVIAGLNGTVEVEDLSPMDEPAHLDVSKPYLQVELIPRAVHFLVPKTQG
jgi:diacylglycerol kinase (ATP)